MKSSTEIKDIAAALSKLQAQNKGADLGSSNPYFKSKYSSLEDVWDSIRVLLGANGLSVVQDVITLDNAISISTTVCHSSGQWIEFGPLQIPFAKKDAQSVGSSITYGRRYSICAALGIVSDSDDDGNAAQCISQDQLEKLLDLIGEDDEYRTRLLEHYKIKSLAEINSSKFQAILKSAQARAENRKKAVDNDGL